MDKYANSGYRQAILDELQPFLPTGPDEVEADYTALRQIADP
jgi:hypothetical protein